jgi:small subunit ribosomal protein S6
LRTYETIIIIDSLLKPEEIDNTITKYERFISANGGKVESLDRWGKRRLAYEINKRQYGFYVLIRFEGPSAMIKQLDREYRLNESLLRTKVIKLDEKALKTLASQITSTVSTESIPVLAEIETEPIDDAVVDEVPTVI